MAAASTPRRWQLVRSTCGQERSAQVRRRCSVETTCSACFDSRHADCSRALPCSDKPTSPPTSQPGPPRGPARHQTARCAAARRPPAPPSAALTGRAPPAGRAGSRGRGRRRPCLRRTEQGAVFSWLMMGAAAPGRPSSSGGARRPPDGADGAVLLARVGAGACGFRFTRGAARRRLRQHVCGGREGHGQGWGWAWLCRRRRWRRRCRRRAASPVVLSTSTVTRNQSTSLHSHCGGSMAACGGRANQGCCTGDCGQSLGNLQGLEDRVMMSGAGCSQVKKPPTALGEAPPPAGAAASAPSAVALQQTCFTGFFCIVLQLSLQACTRQQPAPPPHRAAPPTASSSASACCGFAQSAGWLLVTMTPLSWNLLPKPSAAQALPATSAAASAAAPLSPRCRRTSVTRTRHRGCWLACGGGGRVRGMGDGRGSAAHIEAAGGCGAVPACTLPGVCSMHRASRAQPGQRLSQCLTRKACIWESEALTSQKPSMALGRQAQPPTHSTRARPMPL